MATLTIHRITDENYCKNKKKSPNNAAYSIYASISTFPSNIEHKAKEHQENEVTTHH